MSETLDTRLFEKYDIYAYDYSDYPHKSNWSTNMGDKDYRKALKKLFSETKNPPTLFYTHIPFCRSLCYYCICHKEITKDYRKVQEHLEKFLFKEIDMLDEFFRENSLKPNFREMYIGGGSPTILEVPEFDKLIQKIGNFCDTSNLDRFCVEIDPRTCSQDKLAHYHEKGVNTLSFGVQDLDPEVQKAVNRVQPVELLEQLLESKVRSQFSSINFDFLVGLPMQTEESMQKTMERTLALSPDRISLCFFHYTTKYYPYMKKLEKSIPNFLGRKKIFTRALEVLAKSGYIRTGFEHFAKPDDILAKSIGEKKATYNSFGAVSGNALNVVATGRSGHSIVGESLFQNFYEQDLYAAALSKNEFPIYRGLKLTEDDILRTEIIHGLKTYFSIDTSKIESKMDVPFKFYFHHEIDTLKEFVSDGLVNLNDGELKITEKGKLFTDLIVSVFDKYLKTPRYNLVT